MEARLRAQFGALHRAIRDNPVRASPRLVDLGASVLDGPGAFLRAAGFRPLEADPY